MERSAILGFADMATACPAFRYAPYGLLIAADIAYGGFLDEKSLR